MKALHSYRVPQVVDEIDGTVSAEMQQTSMIP